MVCSAWFCGSLRRLQIPIPPFLLLTHLHDQGAAHFNTCTFMNFCSLQAYSLRIPVVLCEGTQSFCPSLTSQSLPLCTRRAPRSWPQRISLACISSLTCASCRSFLLPWCRLLPGNKTRNISLTPTRLFVSPGFSKPVQREVLLKGRGWGAKCHLSTLELIKATGALTETKSTFPIHTKKLSEITYTSYSVLNKHSRFIFLAWPLWEYFHSVEIVMCVYVNTSHGWVWF